MTDLFSQRVKFIYCLLSLPDEVAQQAKDTVLLRRDYNNKKIDRTTHYQDVIYEYASS